MIQEIELARFVDVHFTQARAGYDNGVIMEYAAMYEDRAFNLPPIEAERVPNTDKYWIVDGHHRFQAADLAGLKTIQAEISESCQSKEEALVMAATRNTAHGLPRTYDDKRMAVQVFLLYGQPELPDYLIAGRLGVSAKLVTNIRKELEESGDLSPRETPKDKAAKAIADPDNSGKSNREIAEVAGVDEKTVRKMRKNEKEQKSAPEQEPGKGCNWPKGVRPTHCAGCGKEIGDKCVGIHLRGTRREANFCYDWKPCAQKFASNNGFILDEKAVEFVDQEIDPLDVIAEEARAFVEQRRAAERDWPEPGTSAHCDGCGSGLQGRSLNVKAKGSDVVWKFCVKTGEKCAQRYADDRGLLFDAEALEFSYPDDQNEPSDYDRQERPSIAKVTDDTRRVIPEAEKPSEPVVVSQESEIHKMIKELKTAQFVSIDRREPLNVLVAKLYAILKDRPEAWIALPDRIRDFRETT